MKKLLFFIFCLSLSFSFFAQPNPSKALDGKVKEEIKIIEDTLGVLGFLMVNDSLPEHRFGACKKFIPQLVKALKKPNSFNYAFDRLGTISILYPPDSTFRIFTWQLYVDKNTYHQYGAIQMNQTDLKLFRLLDRPSNPHSVENQELSPDTWLGAVYYNIYQYDGENGRQYLLFGYDAHSFFSKKKILDVLSFREEKPVFGAPIFEKNNATTSTTTQSRIVLEYSAETSIRLNYDQHLEMIIFDHLIQQPSPFPGQEFTWLPDGSYEGYQMKDGKWTYVEKVFNHQYERGGFPVPEPVLGKDKKKKNIFGNE